LGAAGEDDAPIAHVLDALDGFGLGADFGGGGEADEGEDDEDGDDDEEFDEGEAAAGSFGVERVFHDRYGLVGKESGRMEDALPHPAGVVRCYGAAPSTIRKNCLGSACSSAVTVTV
jgi:hypothetical protein